MKMPIRISVTGVTTKDDESLNSKSKFSMVTSVSSLPEGEATTTENATIESSNAELAPTSVPVADNTTTSTTTESVATSQATPDQTTSAIPSAKSNSTTATLTYPTTTTSDPHVIVETVSIGDGDQEQEEKKDGTVGEAKQDPEQVGKVCLLLLLS
jgi:hypothetical protein